MAILPYFVMLAEIAVVFWFAALFLLLGPAETGAEDPANQRMRAPARRSEKSRSARARRDGSSLSQAQERAVVRPVRPATELAG